MSECASGRAAKVLQGPCLPACLGRAGGRIKAALRRWPTCPSRHHPTTPALHLPPPHTMTDVSSKKPKGSPSYIDMVSRCRRCGHDHSRSPSLTSSSAQGSHRRVDGAALGQHRRGAQGHLAPGDQGASPVYCSVRSSPSRARHRSSLILSLCPVVPRVQVSCLARRVCRRRR